MRSQRIMFVAMAGGVLLCSPAFGGLSFSFSVDQPHYSVAPGQSVDVPVYLQEVVTAPDSSLLAAEGGLGSAGVLVQRTGSSGSDPAIITGAFANDAFDDFLGLTISVADSEAQIVEMRDLFQSSGVLVDETFPGSGIRRIPLGTFTITGGAAVGEVTTFHVGVISPYFFGTQTWDNFEYFAEELQPGSEEDDRLHHHIDLEINATSFDVATVPVTSSVLLGLVGFGTLCRWRRGILGTVSGPRGCRGPADERSVRGVFGSPR